MSAKKRDIEDIAQEVDVIKIEAGEIKISLDKAKATINLEERKILAQGDADDMEKIRNNINN
jgi:hypothetical protein